MRQVRETEMQSGQYPYLGAAIHRQEGYQSYGRLP